MSFEFPSNSAVVGDDKMATQPWALVFSRWHAIITSMAQSGTTADRPVAGLWIGRRYFDTTLGKPVYLKSIRPNVWVDGIGAVS
jgi:hypothetical protein